MRLTKKQHLDLMAHWLACRGQLARQRRECWAKALDARAKLEAGGPMTFEERCRLHVRAAPAEEHASCEDYLNAELSHWLPAPHILVEWRP